VTVLNSFNSRGKAGFILAGIGTLLLLAGMIGYTFTGEIEDVPTPNAPNQAFFSGEPLPEHSLSSFVSAELTITWDRNDVWIALVDAEEKKRCEDVPSFFASGMGCDGTSTNFVAGDSSAIASEGFSWEIESGTYYAALGAKDGALPAGTEVVISYEVHLGHSLLSFLISAGSILAGGVLLYYGRV
jgi:hypothetical protein